MPLWAASHRGPWRHLQSALGLPLESHVSASGVGSGACLPGGGECDGRVLMVRPRRI